MSVTFAVDDVEVAPAAPATTTLREQLGAVLAFGGDGGSRVLAETGVHPLLAAVHAAFAEHRPLVLSPDAVWLTIAQGVAHHVRLHAEALAPRLVRHLGRRKLEVCWEGAFPEDAASLQAIIHQFRAAVAEQIGDGRARLLTCDFSTTTEVERVASEVVLLDAMSPYFEYVLACVCGIPTLTLTGTPEDWKSIRARIDVIAELDLAWWSASLAPIADRLVAAAEGRADVEFFRSLYKPMKAYGWERVTGWVARLFPYVGAAGRYDERNPLLSFPLDWTPPEPDDGGWYNGPGIITSDVPARASSCLVDVRDETAGTRFDIVVEGGLHAVAVDDAGRLEPRAGWTVRRSEGSIASLIEELKARAEVELVPRAGGGEMHTMPAELVALYDAAAEVRMFGWRVRPIRDFEAVQVPLHGGASSVLLMRFLDLPDGTCLAFDWGEGGLYVARLRVDALVKREPQGDIVVLPPRVDSTEAASAIPVVARGIAPLLRHALRSDGSTELPAVATLFDVLPEWQRVPPAPPPARRPRPK